MAILAVIHIAAVLQAVPAAVSPAKLIAHSAELMGGAQAIQAVQRKRSSMLVTIFANQLQEEWPGAPHPVASRDQTWTVDWLGSRYRLERAGPPRLQWVFAPGSAQFALDTTVTAMAEVSAANFETDVLLSSAERLMQLALATPAGSLRSAAARMISGRRVNGVRMPILASTDTVTLWFDAVEGYLNAADMRRTTGGYINALQRTEFANWRKSGDVMLPAFVRTTLNGEAVTLLTMSRTDVNPQLDDSLFASRPYAAAAPKNVQLTTKTYGDHVMRLSGPTHSSVAIRAGNHTVVLEAPASAAQTRAMLDSLRARWPTSPVTDVVVSHHHADHVAGLEPVFAAGITVHASADIVDYLKSFAVTPGDPLPRRKIVGFGDSIDMGTPQEPVRIYRIPNTHVRGLIVAYIPSQKLLIEADLVTGSVTDQRALRDFVVSRKLDVEQLSPVHGPAMTWNEFLAKVK